MSNGVRPIKKMSQNQLTQALVEMNGRFHGLSMAVTNDINQLNILLFSLLKELGKADEILCPSCQTLNVRPLIKGVSVNAMCAECGTRIEPLPEKAFTGEMMDDSEE